MTLSPTLPDFVFECVFDAPSLMEAFKPTSQGVVLLERWLNEPRIRVVIPQHTLDTLKDACKSYGHPSSRSHADSSPHVTLKGLDRITNDFQNVQVEPPLSRYNSAAAVRAAPRPAIYWHDYLQQRQSMNGELSTLSTKLEDTLLENNKKTMVLTSREKSRNTPLESVPRMSMETPKKMLAPIGTGRPISKKFNGELESPKQLALVKEPALHPVFHHIWFLMNAQEGYPLRHVWITISSDSVVEAGAKELGIPCLNFGELRDVLLKEFPNLEQAKTPKSSRSSSTSSLTSFNGFNPSHSLDPNHTVANAVDGDEDEVVFVGKKRLTTLADAVHAPIFKSAKFSSAIKHVDGATSINGAHAPHRSLQQAPREPRADRERRERASSSQPFVLDPNSYERSPRLDGHGPGLNRGRRIQSSDVSRHQSTRSGPDPPVNAPIAPRSMSVSSRNSKLAVRLAAASTTPGTNGAVSIYALPASQPNSPRQSVTQANRSRNHSTHRNGQRPVSREAKSPVVPGSPHTGVNGTQTAPINRGPRQIRSGHGTYVPPPRAREQQEMAASTVVASPLNLNEPIDPDSFGRGQTTPVEKIRTETLKLRTNQDGRHQYSSRGYGGSMRGWGAFTRGRGGLSNERKLFDPN